MEEKIRTLKVAGKLQYAFRLMLTSLIVAIVIGFICVLSLDLMMQSFYKVNYMDNQRQLSIRKDLQAVAKEVLLAAVTDDANAKAENLASADQYAKDFAANRTALEASFSDKKLLQEFGAAADTVVKNRSQVIDYINQGKKEEALALISGDYYQSLEDLQNVLIEIGNVTDQKADASYVRMNVLGVLAIVLMVVSGVIGFVLSRKMAKIITANITEPVEELENAARQLREGQLAVAINYQSEDELGHLAVYIKEACNLINDVVNDTGEILGQMADKNFDINTKIEDQYVGDFRTLIMSMRKLNRQMDETLRHITETSEQVASGAEQLAGGAQSLAEGATDQAGAVEELTATVENVSEISGNSAKSADATAEMVEEEVRKTLESQKEIAQLTAAMERIGATSLQVREIIGAIEDIAAQTNLLSLNASIEAARAGDAGKGFAVVADQIGKLAADSAKSAVTTRNLISESLKEIEEGNQITQRTVEVFNDIVESMKGFVDAAKGSAASSKTQSDMLQQVTAGIEQISTVVQSNSASAQETSAVSEELSAQAVELEKMVSQFKLRAK